MENISTMKIEVPKPVVICIGTPKVKGDSLGPKVGDILINEFNLGAYVYGKTDSPVTGVNCKKYFEHIRIHHKHSLIIAVDACLGSKDDVGKIKYTFDGLRAGSALNKKLGKFGDIALLGIVAESGSDNMTALVKVSEAAVNDLAFKIADKIYNLIDDLRLTYIF